MRVQKAVLMCAAASVLALGAATAQAQTDYPVRDITIVVPYNAGGGSDLIARLLAPEMESRLGVNVLVENRPGAGNAVGATYVQNAAPDGYTLLFTAAAFATTPVTLAEASYSVENFVPITATGTDYNVLLTTVDVADSLESFIEQARAANGGFNYASLGPAGLHEILSEKLAEVADFEWTSVIYPGDGPALTALLSGEIQAYFGGIDTSVPLGEGDGAYPDLVFLGLAGPERSAYAPDVPTFAEQGYPEIDLPAWSAMFVHKDTPEPIVEKLREVVDEARQVDSVRDILASFNITPFEGTPDDIWQMIRDREELVRSFLAEN